jgi:hypothetical protein
MRIDSRAFGLSAATLAAGLFVVCAAAVAIAPQATTAVAITLIHLDLSEMARTITWFSFFAGLLGWTTGTGLVFAAVGSLYNRYQRDLPTVTRADVKHRIA